MTKNPLANFLKVTKTRESDILSYNNKKKSKYRY